MPIANHVHAQHPKSIVDAAQLLRSGRTADCRRKLVTRQKRGDVDAIILHAKSLIADDRIEDATTYLAAATARVDDRTKLSGFIVALMARGKSSQALPKALELLGSGLTDRATIEEIALSFYSSLPPDSTLQFVHAVPFAVSHSSVLVDVTLRTLEKLQMLDESRLIADSVMEDPGRDARNTYVVGDFYRRSGMADRCLDLVDAGLPDDPANLHLLMLRGLALHNLGHFDASVAALEDYIRALMLVGGTGVPKITKPPKFDTERAARALGDFKLLLEARGVPFFLSSGTLLGCCREGSLLSFDKDLDVGVFDDFFNFDIASIAAKSHLFRTSFKQILDPDAQGLYAWLQHRNGVSIDIYRYRREGDVMISGIPNKHENVLFRWTPFGLKETSFLGGTYFVPDDSDRYLSELYGDWRTPDPYFEAFVQSPNLVCRGRSISKSWGYVRIVSNIGTGNHSKAAAIAASMRSIWPESGILSQIEEFCASRSGPSTGLMSVVSV